MPLGTLGSLNAAAIARATRVTQAAQAAQAQLSKSAHATGAAAEGERLRVHCNVLFALKVLAMLVVLLLARARLRVCRLGHLCH